MGNTTKGYEAWRAQARTAALREPSIRREIAKAAASREQDSPGGKHMPDVRKAKVYVRTTGVPALETVQRYLPGNYTARYAEINGDRHILIEGEDNAGWTMEGYIIPRLQSGLIWAQEVEPEDEIA